MCSCSECRRIRSISLTETFDEEVEAVRAAVDAGDFMAYMTAQDGANVPRDDQMVRVARRVAAELNAYDEEVKKVVGIFAPHLGESHVYETRTTEWRIVASAVDSEVLTVKSASGAPRSSVNNCGLGGFYTGENVPLRLSVQTGAELNLNDGGEVSWSGADVNELLGEAMRDQIPKTKPLE